MLHRLLKVFITGLCAVVILGLCTTTAEARRVSRVSGVSRAGQDWAHAKLRIRWRAVAGATKYQMRVGVTPRQMRKARKIRTRTPYGTYTRSLNRSRVYYVQVRALKRRSKGAWSTATRFKFIRPGKRVDVPNGPGGSSNTVYGMNVSPGTSYTNGARETAAQQVSRIVRHYGSLDAAKIFYQGNLPAKFNKNYEGLVPGRTVAVCFKPNQTALANGSLDSAIRGYINSIPAGWKVMLVNWQEPDDEMWKDHSFSPAQHRAATEQLIDIAHGNVAYGQGRVEVWDVYMGFSIDVGRWQDSAVSPRLDGIGWDYYWNKPTTSWYADPTKDLRNMVNVTKRIGIKKWGLFETGDNPHGNDSNGAGRAAFWTKVYNATDALNFKYLLYFNAIGTTGDHRIIPEHAFGARTAAVLRSRM
ncbi:MAG: hypothetical protein JWR85_1223 [Marmoricola sp.]|nr:hypothetical protein [Marmoricola sp.]